MSLKQIKTIIVDDENRIRRGIEKLVLSCGEEWNVVATFGDGQELLDSYQAEPIEFDILITDVRMPIMDGLTLIKEMKKLTSFSPMVISGFDDFSYLQTALREGALDYLIKPIDREEFRIQLETLKEKIMIKWQNQEELEIMEKQSSELAYMKQVKILNEITNGYEIDVSIMDWTNDFPAGIYTLMYITIDQVLSHSRSMEKNEWKTWILAHENIFNEMLSEYKHKYWKWKGEGAAFWILICSSNDNSNNFKNEVYEFAISLKNNVEKYTLFSNTIAISHVFTDLSLLSTVTKDVLALMQYRLIYGENQILQQDMEQQLILEKSETKHANELQQAIHRIIQSLERMNEGELIKNVTMFAKELQTLRVPSEIKLFVQSLSIQMINYLIKHTPRLSNDLLDIQDTSRLLKNIGNFAELNEEIKEWVMAVFNKLVIVNEEKVLNQVEVARSWIVENMKESITIEKIARQVYMNPTYFCEYFKNQTGETVHEFVTSTRISKARELLLTTNLKVYEISELVGYADTKYFSKLFKKYYGELPSKYKEKVKAK
ncbi:helix-turn-helix domain-containing protein [Ureibacillus sp. GCM10028918]|uniref:response regulator transcription factor n=1 Tax=Ureibacillus sp. GCM10028918 TaxID=3273429 RepID=UPI003612D28A